MRNREPKGNRLLDRSDEEIERSRILVLLDDGREIEVRPTPDEVESIREATGRGEKVFAIVPRYGEVFIKEVR